MDDQVQNLGLDANGFITEANSVARALDGVTEAMTATALAFSRGLNSTDEATLKLKNADAAGNSVTKTFKFLEGGVQELGTAFALATNKIDENAKRLQSTYHGVQEAHVKAYQQMKADYDSDTKAFEKYIAEKRREEQQSQAMGFRLDKLKTESTEQYYKKIADESRKWEADQKAAYDRDAKLYAQYLDEKRRREQQSQAMGFQLDQHRDRTTQQFEKENEPNGLNFSGLDINYGKLLGIQLLHTAIRDMVSEIRNSITTTVEFQKRISEIRTISQQSAMSFDDWSVSVRRLSDEFGNPVLEVAEGLYETISNQIAKGADAAIFMGKAMEFARTTHSTTAQAVNLLSSALNSFSMSAGDTDKVAASFFKTIDLGRVRAQDIAETFGRTGPLASSLGVSLDEVNAAIATLTIKGVPANESLVLLNNLMTHLLKPTKDMKESFKEMGVTSGEQAIALKGGLIGVLGSLNDITKGSTTAIAEEMRDMRAMRAEIGLSGDALELYRRNLQAISGAQGEYGVAKTLSFESPGARLEREVQRIKNFIQFDYTTGLLAQIDQLSRSLSNEGLLGVFKDLIKVGSNLIEFWAAYKIATVAVTVANTGLSASFLALATNPVGWTALAIYGIGKLVEAYNDLQIEIRESYGKAVEAARAANLKITEQQQKELAKQNEDFNKALNQRFAGYAQNSNEITDRAEQFYEHEKEALADSVENTRQALADYVSEWRKAYSEIEKAHAKALNEIAKAEEDLNRNREFFADAEFRRQMKLAEHADVMTGGKGKLFEGNQINLIMDRLTQLQAERNNLINTGDSAGIQKNVKTEQSLNNDLLERRIKLEEAQVRNNERIAELKERIDAKESISATGSHKDPRSFMRADEQSRKDQVELDKMEAQAQAYANSLAKLPSVNDLQARNNQLQNDANDALGEYIARKQKDVAATDAQAKSAKEQFNLLETALKAYNKFKTDKPEIKSSNDLQDQLAKFDSLVGDLETSGLYDPEAFARIYEERASIVAAGEAKLLEIQAKSNAASQEQLKNAMIAKRKELTDQYSEISQKLLDVTTGPKAAIAQLTKFAEFGPNLMWKHEGESDFSENDPRRPELILKTASETLNKIDAAIKAGKSPDQNLLTTLNAQIAATKEQIPDRRFGEHVTDKATVNDLLKQIEDFSKNLAELLPKRNQAKAEIDKITADVGTPAEKVSDAFGTLSDRARELAEEMKRLGQSIPGGNTVIEHKAFGGPIGTDTILSWVSPGEYVMNARSAARFAPQLEAMNRYYAEGGFVGDFTPTVTSPSMNTVTNNSGQSGDSYHFGNINISGADNQQMTPEQMVNVLVQELRRTGARLHA